MESTRVAYLSYQLLLRRESQLAVNFLIVEPCESQKLKGNENQYPLRWLGRMLSHSSAPVLAIEGLSCLLRSKMSYQCLMIARTLEMSASVVGKKGATAHQHSNRVVLRSSNHDRPKKRTLCRPRGLNSRYETSAGVHRSTLTGELVLVVMASVQGTKTQSTPRNWFRKFANSDNAYSFMTECNSLINARSPPYAGRGPWRLAVVCSGHRGRIMHRKI
jgi:hypothetical protein